MLWENNILGCTNPRQLINTLLYFFGLHFSLRAAQEHRDIEYGENSQVKLLKSQNGEEYLQYTERISKNRKFGLKCTRLIPKTTYIYPAENPLRCPINIYKKYIQHRPESSGKAGNAAFYLAIIDTPKTNTWFKSSPMGIHSLQSATKRMLSQVDSGYFTNTSLRRTCQNRLLHSGLPNEIIHKKTGRVSCSADQAYIDSAKYEKAMSCAIYGQSSVVVVGFI